MMVGIARGHDIDCTVAPTHNEGTESLVYRRALLMFEFLGGMT